MRKNLLLTCLLSLVAMFAMAQETTTWPITLTTADGLPGSKVVRNYTYQSETFNLDEAVSTLRFTVISTNTVDSLTTHSNDGLSVSWGTGFPFFTMSELRIYDGTGKRIEYVATGNSVASNDGGGLEALSDNNEGTYLHTTFSKGTLPNAYHYIELELEEAVTSFSFNWNTRSDYHKNLITYMGITPGTLYLPYPDQEFQLGEQVTSVEELAEEGALFVIRTNAEDYQYNPNDDINRLVKGHTYFHSPYGADETANAASLVYLTADPDVENGYKVGWLNNGHYMIDKDFNSSWYHWTNDILKAATIEFAPCDTVENAFVLTQKEGAYTISYDPIGKMSIVDEEGKGNRARPNTYNWNIYKASIKGSAIVGQLQEMIDDAQARINAIGGAVENDEGEYEALEAALTEARALVADPEVSAASIITTKRSLNMLTAAYAAVGLWAYIDSIDFINNEVEEGRIAVSSAPDWVEGSYSETALEYLSEVSEQVMIVIDTYQSLADIDAAIALIYSAVDAFWASKVANVKSLPFRIGTTEDGLPGEMQSYGGYKWESPLYNITEEVDGIRLTFFKTNNNATYAGTEYVFPTFAEIEFYDGFGNKIALTADSFESNAMRYNPDGASGDNQGFPALVDGKLSGSWAHCAWDAGQVPDYDANPTYMYLDITFPEPISSFKYVQYGRQNGVNTPTDFVIGAAGEAYTPDDVVIVDSYNTKVGEQITDASQITDDGFYALVGLLNCAPEGNGEGFEKFYTSNLAYGKKIGAPAVFSIRKTGDADGTFYIQSLADGKYWSAAIDDDGWGGNSVTAVQAEAAKMNIVPTNREALGKEEYPNTFVIYQYRDTVMRDGTPHPYIIAQDWGDKVGYFSSSELANNDWDGQGEWKIFKVTMDTPHCYWLKVFVAAAEAMNLQVGPDPGFYSEESAGTYAAALTKAQNALATGDDATAKVAIGELETAIAAASQAVVNPVLPGKYVFEAAYRESFIASTGATKFMCTYYNDFEATGPESEYSLYWGDAPKGDEYIEINDRYKFELIPASESDKVQIWLEDGVIDSAQAANAYYIKSIEVGQYAGTSMDGERSRDIGLTVEPEEPYIVRSQGAYVFDFWHPSHGKNSMHLEGNSGGKGVGGDIVYWTGTDKASQWFLRSIDARTSINNNVAEEGDEVVSVSYYTVGGAAVATPVQGINIVKTVYANGVVKTAKVYVK